MTDRTRAVDHVLIPAAEPDLSGTATLATALSRRGVAPEAVGEVAARIRATGLRPVIDIGPRVLLDPHAGAQLATALRDRGDAVSGPRASAVVARWLDGVQMVMTAMGVRRRHR
jgi:hypothetical protein